MIKIIVIIIKNVLNTVQANTFLKKEDVKNVLKIVFNVLIKICANFAQNKHYYIKINVIKTVQKQLLVI